MHKQRQIYTISLGPKKRHAVHEQEWNSRAYLEKIPNYFSKSSLQENIFSNKKLKNLSSSVSTKLNKNLNLHQSLHASPANLSYLSPLKPSPSKKSIMSINPPISFPKESKLRSAQLSINLSKATKPASRKIVIKSRIPIKPFLKKQGSRKISEKKSGFAVISNTEPDEASSDLEDSSSESLLIFDMITSHYLLQLMAEICEMSAVEAQQELLSASLILFSSFIMDKYLSEVLSQEIPEIAKRNYLEAKEIDFIDSQNDIINEAVEQELAKFVDSFNNSRISSEIGTEFIFSISLKRIVEEILQEDEIENVDAGKIILDEIVDELLSDEAITILVEDEVGMQRMEKNLDFFPINLQREFYQKNREKIVERMTEDAYFSLLNDMAEDWTRCIAEICITGADDDQPEAILPIRRAARLR